MTEYTESPKEVIDTPEGLLTSEDAKRLQFTLASAPYVIERGQKAGGMYYTMIILSNLDEAIVGVHESELIPPVVIYCTPKILAKLIKDGMPEEDAREYFDYNIIGSHMGAQTPRYIDYYQEEDSGEYSWQYDM